VEHLVIDLQTMVVQVVAGNMMMAIINLVGMLYSLLQHLVVLVSRAETDLTQALVLLVGMAVAVVEQVVLEQMEAQT
jgi:hypothetical protein